MVVFYFYVGWLAYPDLRVGVVVRSSRTTNTIQYRQITLNRPTGCPPVLLFHSLKEQITEEVVSNITESFDWGHRATICSDFSGISGFTCAEISLSDMGYSDKSATITTSPKIQVFVFILFVAFMNN